MYIDHAAMILKCLIGGNWSFDVQIGFQLQAESNQFGCFVRVFFAL